MPTNSLAGFTWLAEPAQTHRATALMYERPVTSQAVRRILNEQPRTDGLTDATLELTCGCVIEARLDADRLPTADDGVRLAVGKYPCPLGHPARRPQLDRRWRTAMRHARSARDVL